MSGPDTIPLDSLPSYPRPITQSIGGDDNSQHQEKGAIRNENTFVQKGSTALALIALIASAVAVVAVFQSSSFDKEIRQEYAAHDREVREMEIKKVDDRLAELIKQQRLLDNDWQITNAWLAEHHVVKDAHGNYHFER